MRDHFSTYHPLINFIYFVFVIGVGMFLMHPVYLALGLLAALTYNGVLHGGKALCKRLFLFVLPMMILVALLNPLFNHYGVTILFYLRNGNPVTLESMLFGLAMSVMLCQMVLWFWSYNKVMTSEKLMYLLSRLIPALSLILAMCMRFIPRFQKRMEVVRQGQKCIGRDVSNGSLLRRIRYGIKMLSILVTWSLESALQTADSMHSRGYGLPGRTAFSLYRFDKRDRKLAVLMALLMSVFFWTVLQGSTAVSYDPKIVVEGLPLNVRSSLAFLSYLGICNLPVLVDWASERRWKQQQKTVQKSKKGEYRLWTVSD